MGWESRVEIEKLEAKVDKLELRIIELERLLIPNIQDLTTNPLIELKDPILEHKCKYVKRYGESCTLNNNCKYPNCEE